MNTAKIGESLLLLLPVTVEVGADNIGPALHRHLVVFHLLSENCAIGILVLQLISTLGAVHEVVLEKDITTFCQTSEHLHAVAACC